MDPIVLELLKNAGPNAGMLFMAYLFVTKMMKQTKTDLRTELKEIAVALRENTKEIHDLNVKMAKAETKFEMLDRYSELVNKNSKDINTAFEQLRIMKSQV